MRYWRMGGAKTREVYGKGSPAVGSCVVHEQRPSCLGRARSYRYHRRGLLTTDHGPRYAGAAGFSNLPSRIESLFLGWHIVGPSALNLQAPLLPPSPTLPPDREGRVFLPLHSSERRHC